ncbi:MAG: sigma-70 family RNA polymerase sigma factor [Acidobacteria bacterium]|nr:sigma-70 family RNA polymerase sigma factor [Acidobacteriota bacterium]
MTLPMDPKAEDPVNKMVDHLFRHSSGQMVAVLTRIFGFENLEIVEDAIQETLIKALRQWTIKGIPENPTAWMIQVAKNHILDQFRRAKKFDSTEDKRVEDLRAAYSKSIDEKFRYPRELQDDLLCMMFAVCDPVLMPDSQIALTLKIVGGFSVSEIAQGFLGSEEAVAKMITRAKTRLKESKPTLEVPPPDDLEPRIEAVLKVLYLMFNEGYSTSGGKEGIRSDLCFEAIRLGRILSEHPVTGSPKVEALLALFFFQGARLQARNNGSHDIMLLADQERGLWDRKMISAGLFHLKRSASGSELSNYHLEAEIASCYVLAADLDSTDWTRILECYDRLLDRKYSAVIALNRIIVLSKVKGTAAALNEIEQPRVKELLQKYLPFHIAYRHLLLENERLSSAEETYKYALSLSHNEPTRRFLQKKLADVKEFMGRCKS